MQTSRLKLSSESRKFLKDEGYETLYPPQADAVKAGLLRGKSLLISAPTASGKTLMAMMAMLSHLERKDSKIIYLSPLKALAAEKHAEFGRIALIPRFAGVRVRISTGDYDARDSAVSRGDIVIMTNEKMDSAMRHNAELADKIGLIVIDEAHLLGDPLRGPTLEMILSKIKAAKPRPQIVCLSATVANPDEIAKWLGIGIVSSEWRPVKLTEGVYSFGSVKMQDGKKFKVPETMRGPQVELAADSVKTGGQALVFASTRPSAMSLAGKAKPAMRKLLTEPETAHLQEISDKILAGSENTRTVKLLADAVKDGAAFHHAGLDAACREIVEREFRAGAIKMLASTPTLAAGVNLPARRVVISSLSRYNPRTGGNEYISVMEYKQFCGRAGRPQYDDYGEAIIIAKSDSARMLREMYIEGEIEPIESQLIQERSLRIHALSLIATSPGIRESEIKAFFEGTLGGMQYEVVREEPIYGAGFAKYGIKSDVGGEVKETLNDLESGGFAVKKGERYAATKLGKKVTLLYIDPATATSFIDALNLARPKAKNTLGFLYLISECGEFFPKFSVRRSEQEICDKLISKHKNQLFSYSDKYSRSMLALHYWIEEKTDVEISDQLGIESGDMRRMTESAQWLAHALFELAKAQGKADLLEELDALESRIAYGIREELIELARVRGIGRVRARRLFAGGTRTVSDLRKMSAVQLAKVDRIGRRTAERIKSQLKSRRR